MIQIFGGPICAKFGSKKILTISIFLSSLATICIPLARFIPPLYDYIFIIVLRIISGISQGFLYPACLPIILKWSPSKERVKITSFISAGSSLGVILCTMMNAPICKITGYWEINFLIIGALGFTCMIPWLILVSDSPHESRYISFHELTYIQETVQRTNELMPISEWPLKRILTSKSVIINIITNILSDFAIYGLFSVFSIYLTERMSVDLLTVSKQTTVKEIID